MKIYEVRIPDGQVVNLTGAEYKQFLAANSLDQSHMNKTLKGGVETAKGFKLLRRYSINYDRAQAMSSIEIKAYKSATVARDQANELRGMVRSNARFEWLKSEIVKKMDSFNKTKPLLSAPIQKEKESGTVGVCIVSDWHVGLAVENKWNKFNSEVLKSRVSQYVQQVIENGKNDNIDTLVVLSLGDMINGIISTSVRLSSEIDICEQVVLASELISEMLNEFSKHFCVSYGSTYGNHGRMSASKKDSSEGENFELLISEMVKSRLKDNQNIYFIENNFDKSLIDIKLFGMNIFASHGDKEKLTSVVSDYASLTKIVPDVVFLGHYHHKIIKEVNGSEVIVCPSMSGADSYAVSLRRASKPSQLYLTIDENGIKKEERIRFE